MSAKNPKGSPRGFPPRPYLRAGEIQNPRRISKNLVSVLRTLLPENSFAKPSPYLHFCTSPHSPRLLVARCRAFPRTSTSAEALCFAQRRFSARGTLEQTFKIGSDLVV